jgi:NlpC/P60 family putative phage cell wall peptidase
MRDLDSAEEARLRQAIIDEAKTWIGTRFHHMACVKGAGVDCLNLIYGVYRAVGLVGEIEIPFYRPDQMLHRDEETYLAGLLQHGHEVPHPQPGDVALFTYGRLLWHGAIVTEWPRLIHAFAEQGKVCPGDGENGRLRAHRPVKFISWFSGASSARAVPPKAEPIGESTLSPRG